MSKSKKISFYILTTALIIITSFSISISAASSYDKTSKTKSFESLIQIGSEKVRTKYTIGGWFAWDNAQLYAEASGTNASVELYHADNGSTNIFVKESKSKTNGYISLVYNAKGTMYLKETSCGLARTNSHLVKLTIAP